MGDLISCVSNFVISIFEPKIFLRIELNRKNYYKLVSSVLNKKVK